MNKLDFASYETNVVPRGSPTQPKNEKSETSKRAPLVDPILAATLSQFRKINNDFHDAVQKFFPKPKKGDPFAMENIKIGYFIRAHLTIKQLLRVYAELYHDNKSDPAKLLLVAVCARVSLVVAFPFMLIHIMYKARNRFHENIKEFGKTTYFQKPGNVNEKLVGVEKFNELIVKSVFGKTISSLISIFMSAIPGFGLDINPSKQTDLRVKIARPFQPLKIATPRPEKIAPRTLPAA